MSEKRDLIVVANMLPIAIRQRMEVAEFVGDTLERRDIQAFFREFPELFIDCLERHYPLDAELMEQYAGLWHWRTLIRNNKISWSREVVYALEKNFEWADVDGSSAICDVWFGGWESLENRQSPQFWTFLSRFGRLHQLMIWDFSDRMDFDALSERLVLWDSDVIVEHEQRWNWSALSGNPSLPWSADFIARYESRWDWNALAKNVGIPWSSELIDQFLYRWDWEELSRVLGESYEDSDEPHKACDWVWTIDLIERYGDFWDWEALSKRTDLPWSIELIDYFADEWDWLLLSQNESLPWTTILLEQYLDRWCFHGDEPENGGLSQNTAVPWSVEFVERFEEKWDWEYLSGNPALPWSIALIEKYQNSFWWWGEAISNGHLQKRYSASLSGNRGLPWSQELLERYSDRWDWKRISSNSAVTFDGAILDRFSERVDFRRMSFSSRKIWTEETITRHQDRICWRYLSIRQENGCRTLYRRFSERYDRRMVARDCSFGIEKLERRLVALLLKDFCEVQKLPLILDRARRRRAEEKQRQDAQLSVYKQGLRKKIVDLLANVQPERFDELNELVSAIRQNKLDQMKSEGNYQ